MRAKERLRWPANCRGRVEGREFVNSANPQPTQSPFKWMEIARIITWLTCPSLFHCLLVSGLYDGCPLAHPLRCDERALAVHFMGLCIKSNSSFIAILWHSESCPTKATAIAFIRQLSLFITFPNFTTTTTITTAVPLDLIARIHSWHILQHDYGNASET